eukprot:8925624-Lingulodinium_polyedra.AAC.1
MMVGERLPESAGAQPVKPAALQRSRRSAPNAGGKSASGGCDAAPGAPLRTSRAYCWTSPCA